MRILIVKVSSLGDIIHTLPAVTDARAARRDLEFDWVVEENFTEVPAWHPAVVNVIPVAIRRWRGSPVKSMLQREFADFQRRLKQVHYDLVIDAQGLIKSGVISRLSRGLTIGLSSRTVREPLATLFYNKVYSVPWTQHAVERVRVLFSRALNYRYDRSRIDYGLDMGRINGTAARQSTRRPGVLFLHGTTWHTKHLPPYYWRQLAHIATEAGYEVLMPWGAESERQRAQFVARGNRHVKVLPRQSLSGLAGHIHQAAGVIAVDTGLGHLAAALAKPTVSLYGPTRPELSGTYGRNQIHLKSNLGCAPCVKKTCGYNGPGVTGEYEGAAFPVTPPCFASHQPETVWRQFETLLGGAGARPADRLPAG